MTDAWRTVFDRPVSQAQEQARDAVKDAFALVAMSLRVNAIETCHCGTCEQDLPEDLRVRLASTVPAGATAAVNGDIAGTAAIARASALEGFARKDVRGEVRVIWEALRDARLAQADAEGRIADANKTLEGHDPDELRRRKTTLTEIGGKIHASQEAIRQHNEKIAEQDEAIARFSKRLKAAGTRELAAFEQRERVLLRAHAVFEAAVERYKADLRQRVEATATSLFLKMTTEEHDYARLAIIDHYGLPLTVYDSRAVEIL
jgi:hypothetical protein